MAIEIIETRAFRVWLDGLKDDDARGRIQVRLDRVRGGLFGDVEPVGSGVSELRIHYGPGYRVYFVRRGKAVVLLLGGGTKASQKRDINAAIALAATC